MLRPSFALMLLAAMAVVGVAVGCGEEGVTPTKCPPLPLYDIHDPSYKTNPDVQAQLDAAYAAKCATPAGTAVSGELDSGAPVLGGAGGQSAVSGAGGAI
jgi:hypothetical protein